MSVRVAPGRWPLLGHAPALARERVRFTDRLYEHGDVVKLWLGPLQTYFLTNPELVHRVLVTDSSSFGMGILFQKFRPYAGNGLALSDGPFHRRQRRLMLPAFSRQRLRQYAEPMVTATEELLGSWRPGEVREVDADMKALAVTNVGRALFGTELGEEAIREARRSIPLVIKLGMVRVFTPGFVEKLPLPTNRGFDEATARMKAVVRKLIAEREDTDADTGDLLSLLLRAEDAETGERMTEPQVHDEVMTLLTAGIETTALILSWACHELGRSPGIQARVAAELDEVLAGRPVTFDDLPELTYTGQVVNEVLRMYPLWLMMRRAEQEVELGGLRVRPGQELAMSPHALHYDPRFWDRPEVFDPDRWSTDRVRELPPGVFIPFGNGIRQCIGNSFARNEVLIAVATIFARWRLAPSGPVRQRHLTMPYPSRLNMTVMPRD
ncbi:cytochrome P450 [Allokutzneria sp. A3M-2-11 16]|uniref:cytochrome P450 n=1 Tax=Allokutzneria sp. A3M-2-11 16 TaxID=2962043 RepID=UPI0020B8A02E|nr:cytochrome P450 [Allokutzneria sp. A3M-2-11 16]MCP3798435.1 cytochrome P450 [Allokutzneria sp. A3M-2-11 16]